eukprot:SM000012S25373  [mRNA]  locus=s12:786704:789231:+ [translate_table: standard]
MASCARAARHAMPEENVPPTVEPGVDPALQAHRAERTRLLAGDSVTVDPSAPTCKTADDQTCPGIYCSEL